MLEIALDKELTDCLEETHTKLKNVILAVIVKCDLNMVWLPLWLQQSQINSNGMVGFRPKAVSEQL